MSLGLTESVTAAKSFEVLLVAHSVTKLFKLRSTETAKSVMYCSQYE